MRIHEPSEAEYESLIGEAPFAVVLIDAGWDVGPGAVIRPLFEAAAEAYGERVLFAAIDCDEHVPMMRALPLGSVPAVAYYRGGRLVAALIGAAQDVAARTRALLEGRPIRRGDGCDRSRRIPPYPDFPVA